MIHTLRQFTRLLNISAILSRYRLDEFLEATHLYRPMTLLRVLAPWGRRGVADKRAAMFDGAPINETEGRAVLHTALRNPDGGPLEVAGADPERHVLLPLPGAAAHGHQGGAGRIGQCQ